MEVYLFSYKLQKFRTVGTRPEAYRSYRGKKQWHVRMITTEQKNKQSSCRRYYYMLAGKYDNKRKQKQTDVRMIRKQSITD